ncbi:MAG: UvrB/UvrC motif-containing protein, partial [Terasakiella sp.]|nr:UvrB/UvrC motif-containing protein [Terasakiella sp.]
AKGAPKGSAPRDKRRDRAAAPIPYEQEYTHTVDIAADPVVAYMSAEQLERSIAHLRTQMLDAAKNMEFIEAARLRDEIIKLESRHAEMTAK